MIGVASIDGARLCSRLDTLGEIGRSHDGRLSRLALSDGDKEGRDLLVRWMRELDLEVTVDAIGNIFGTWSALGGETSKPVMLGSHIDTVMNAGIYDGAYGVLAALEVVAVMRAHGATPRVPIAVAAFTNEEGVRFTPDMMGSLVVAGMLPLEQALAARDPDGISVGEELRRIGYAGTVEPSTMAPGTYFELHIEQGPLLERDGSCIGAVTGVQGISWQRITIRGEANHAGTTPMAGRIDAGYAAARAQVFMHQLASRSKSTVATVGTILFHPNMINVIPGEAQFTVDLRDASEDALEATEAELLKYCRSIEKAMRVAITSEQLVRCQPMHFDSALVDDVERSAVGRGFSVRRLMSGAGHDAQVIARVAPATMIFVPSAKGVSHSPLEHTDLSDLVAGANVLLDVTCLAALGIRLGRGDAHTSPSGTDMSG